LEKFCEHLHGLSEKNIDYLLLDDTEDEREQFNNYRKELTEFAEMTKKFYRNFLEGIESESLLSFTNNCTK
jgi:hypothetical protein